jgi:D-glycero-D-manno-heptose 1,7-bisphosphate phosphatase
MSAIFLDRDGVIIRKAPEGDYVKAWNDVEFLPGSLEAIAAFTRHGRKVIIITNQRGVATGKIELRQLVDIHRKMKEVVRDNGGDIAGIYHCPHDKSEVCLCRKPNPGMLLRAAIDHQLRLSECWMIGDALTDIEAGKSVGCRTALITHGNGRNTCKGEPDLCAESLQTAAKYILELGDPQPLTTPGQAIHI